jgi:hypothetical protein
MGFVEFAEHSHAIAALRELNNNPTIFSKDRRPIVEFAIEDVKILKLRCVASSHFRAPPPPIRPPLHSLRHQPLSVMSGTRPHADGGGRRLTAASVKLRDRYELVLSRYCTHFWVGEIVPVHS